MRNYKNYNFYKHYKDYNRQLFSFISSRVEKREDVEEILQDTWMSISDSLLMFNGKSSFLTWACAIAKHEIADFYRKRKLKTFVFSHLPFVAKLVSQALGPELLFEKTELKNDLEKVINNLSEGYQKILRLKYIEGKTMAEIAEIMELSVKAVESRLFRARFAFKITWKENFSNTDLNFSPSFLLKRPI